MKNLLFSRSALICGSLLAFMPYGHAAGAAVQADLTAPQVLENVRKAVHFEEYAKLPRGLNIQGEARAYGEPGTYALLASSQGPYVLKLAIPAIGQVPQQSVFDGRTFWSSDWSGATCTSDPGSGEQTRFYVDAQTHSWLDPARRYVVKVGETTEKSVRLDLATADGRTEAEVTVDRSTWLPRSMTIEEASPPRVVTLEDYRPEQGVLLPHVVTAKRGPSVDTLTVKSVSQAPMFVRSPYTMLSWRATDTSFDLSKPAALEVRGAQSGHLLVHPLVNGKDVGWFILDTGAGCMVIDTKTAGELKLAAVGEMPTMGVGGLVMGHFRPVAEFTLGRATVRGMLFNELDLSGLDSAFGVKVAGIVGYDLFRRAVVEIDLAGKAASLDDPAHYKLTRGSWQPLEFAKRTPYATAAFGKGLEGPFQLDTGAMANVIFHDYAVKRYRLTEGRTLQKTGLGGVGGGASASTGKIEAFTLGGKTFTEPTVTFSHATTGALADRFLVGTIGHPFMRPFKLVFDYTNRRMAFVPRETDRAAASIERAGAAGR